MKLNKIIAAILFVFVVVSAQDIYGQSIELSGFTGIHLGGKVRLYEGDFKINDAQSFGGRIAVGLSSHVSAEFSYMRTDTEGRLYRFIGSPGDLVSFSSNYFQLGSVQELNYGRIAPFGTVTLGLTWWDPKNSAYASKTQFSAGVGGGLKLWLTDLIGIRLQGNLLLPMIFDGFGFGCGIGTGGADCGGGLYTRVTPVQGEFSAGIIFKISPNNP